MTNFAELVGYILGIERVARLPMPAAKICVSRMVRPLDPRDVSVNVEDNILYLKQSIENDIRIQQIYTKNVYA